ncbi:MAG: type I methionyl aminopeptidase [Candidatus Omnitrophica bacterium]|nr:type I methionyl aminopeptidase [Candidatus Omnitrophota bacterium]MDD5310653.1 type I methionyl aminopeptidase [Candidatus Omnitrophota bacterium]MDD5545657.1 type I methionyl aminopeptidase [Candidatus Omnitrophota bacterium]
MIMLRSRAEVEKIEAACRIVADTLEHLGSKIKPGMATAELDILAEEYIKARGAVSAFKGYKGFPANICTSVNETVVHGIPGKQTLKEGDIIALDIGVKLNGYFGDAAMTFPVGGISEEASKLITVTEESLYKGIENARPDKRLCDISSAVQEHVENNGFSVVREFVGHGIGTKMHEDPQIPNYGAPGTGPRLKAGMVLAIEPMVNTGTHRVEILEDGWTAVTKDRKLSAHFEHTVYIGDNGPEILTEWRKKKL